MPQSIIPLLTLCWAAGCNVLGSADVDHLDMLQRGAASLESVERDEAATELEGSSSNDGATDGNAGAPAPAPACERRCQRKYDKFVKKGKEKQGLKKTCKKSFCAGCDFCADEPETPAPPAPAPAPKISFSKVQEDRYWGCDRKGMGNLHGFGHSTVQECFAATLKDPACKGLFDYNQGYNGQCKCMVVDGCTALRGIRGYIADNSQVDDA